MIELTNEDFTSLIKGKKVVVDFYAKWCGPCRMLTPIFTEVSLEMKDILFIRVDIDEHDDITDMFNIMSVPTIMILEDGNEVKRSSGFVSKEKLIDLIKNV